MESVFGTYEGQGASLTTLLTHRHDPTIATMLRETRSLRRSEIARILKSAKGDLRIPFPHAVALAFVSTNHAAWSARHRSSVTARPNAVSTADVFG